VQFIGIPSILKPCSVPISNQRHPTVLFDPHRMAMGIGELQGWGHGQWAMGKCQLRFVGMTSDHPQKATRLHDQTLIINTKQAALCQLAQG